jgi:hypothetical protein
MNKPVNQSEFKTPTVTTGSLPKSSKVYTALKARPGINEKRRGAQKARPGMKHNRREAKEKPFA